YMQSTKDPLTF
nr:immunoglobulin light chain junction region [Macaca mulatta]